MKRILVVDESQAVLETLVIILGREFTVAPRLLPPDGSVAYPEEKADLLILGAPARWAAGPSLLVQIASQVPYPVLFLLDSRFAAHIVEEQEGLECLSKPFNPYTLREKVERLLAQPVLSRDSQALASAQRQGASRYVDFPYLPAAVSELAKRFALTPLPILIVGEAGCGQERVARGIYSLSGEAGPWISAHAPEIGKDCLVGQIARLARTQKKGPQRLTLFLNGLECLNPPAQSSLLGFLEEQEERGMQFWILSNSRQDLLEKVYRGEFLNSLYHRLGTLTLRMLPLRERRQDVPALASGLAQEYGRRLGLGQVRLAPEALERLSNYLWFGNLDEMEAVIARTLATHRKPLVEASDLVFGFPQEGPLPFSVAAEESGKGESWPASESRNGDGPDLKVLINELAHELKNPMVTIKTFAQLLGERFDDADFRVRFQETVGGDIERMDELLEALLDFSRFTHPAAERVPLYEQLRCVLEEILPEFTRRDATVSWGRKGEAGVVFADRAQFHYVFKSLLRAALAQVKAGGKIQIDVDGDGSVTLAYPREGAPTSPFARYLDLPASAAGQEPLPLQLHLAKILLERNGGRIELDHLEGGTVRIRTELPLPGSKA